jgi:hypothetical protein
MSPGAIRPRVAPVPPTLAQRVIARLRARGLYSEATRIASVCGVLLEDACSEDNSQSSNIARAVIFRWLTFDYGKGRIEIAQLFERDDSVVGASIRCKTGRIKFVRQFEEKLGMKREP